MIQISKSSESTLLPDCPLPRQPGDEVDCVGAEEVEDAAAHRVVAQPRVALTHQAARVHPHVAVVHPGGNSMVEDSVWLGDLG